MTERIYYDSKTGNVERFVHKVAALTSWEIIRIDQHTRVSQPGHFITFTTKFGDVPDQSAEFVRTNRHQVKSVSSSGNRNWGQNFGRAGDLLSEEFDLPLLFKFELSGTSQDVECFINKIAAYHDYNKEMDIAQ